MYRDIPELHKLQKGRSGALAQAVKQLPSELAVVGSSRSCFTFLVQLAVLARVQQCVRFLAMPPSQPNVLQLLSS